MEAMLSDLDFATAYLDDILITSKSLTEHRKHIMCVFDKLGFKVKEAKCDFFLSEIKYLGHIINKDNRQLDPDRTNCKIKNMIVDTIRELPVTLEDIKREALKDVFTHTIKNKICNKDLNVPEVFALCDYVLLYNNRVVIPSSLQKKILRDFHMGHLGKTHTKSLMHCSVYWSNMDKDITNMVDSCKRYALAAKAPATTYKPWPKMTSTISLSLTATLNSQKS